MQTQPSCSSPSTSSRTIAVDRINLIATTTYSHTGSRHPSYFTFLGGFAEILCRLLNRKPFATTFLKDIWQKFRSLNKIRWNINAYLLITDSSLEYTDWNAEIPWGQRLSFLFECSKFINSYYLLTSPNEYQENCHLHIQIDQKQLHKSEAVWSIWLINAPMNWKEKVRIATGFRHIREKRKSGTYQLRIRRGGCRAAWCSLRCSLIWGIHQYLLHLLWKLLLLPVQSWFV